MHARHQEFSNPLFHTTTAIETSLKFTKKKNRNNWQVRVRSKFPTFNKRLKKNYNQH